MTALLALFGFTALLYASVGFAGGSTYTALLVLFAVDHTLVPVISLACNIVVATGGVIRFGRARVIPWRRILPLLAISVPCAWYGGQLPVDKAHFVLVLGISLAVAGLLLLLGPDSKGGARHTDEHGPGWRALLISGPLGLLSGIVGIGGGIFLAPCLHLMRWDSARRIAGTAAAFILVNSIAGILGQLSKLDTATVEATARQWWPHVVVVLIAGQIGSHVGVRWLSPPLIRRVTGVVVLLAAARLLTS